MSLAALAADTRRGSGSGAMVDTSAGRRPRGWPAPRPSRARPNRSPHGWATRGPVEENHPSPATSRAAKVRPMARTTAVGGSDRVLLDRLRAGDERALADIFDSYGGYVYGLVRRVSGSEIAPGALPQDVFPPLWLPPSAVAPERGSIRTFLGVVAHRRAVDWVRSETRRHARDERAGRRDHVDADISEAAADRVVAAHVRAALEQ